jgi:hypothetical protein
VVASQDVAQRFLAKYGSYCPVDGVILKNEPKQTLVPKLWKLWAHQIPNQKAIDTFHELRLRWRSSRCRHRKQLRADEFDELYNSLAGFSLGYYKTVEKFYEAATQGRISEMGNMVDTIKKAMDVTPDAIIAYAHYIMMNKNSGEAAEFLMEELLPHRLFTVEKAYHAARVLARWGQKEQLKRLMEHWKMRYDFPLRAYYYFSMSLYHRITGDVASQTLCLKKSILFDPLNVDHILALVELYEEKELFETAEQIRLVLKSSDLAAEFNFENEARKAG